MINKILIRKSDRKTLHKDRRSLGMSGENLQEVLLFCLDEKIEGTGIVEVELPNGEKGMIEVERTEEGYELPVKSSLLTQTGFVKFQLRILHDNEEIFKSEIIALEVKDSINATATIPEEYPSWVDTLTNLKKDLEKAESERVSNENERISAEKTRQENFTEMQKTVENATSNIKDLKEDYNENAKQKTEEFNKNFEEKQKAINDNAEAKTTAFGENAEAQTKTFNTNSDDKLAEYNRNHTAKMKEFDDNYDTKTKTFDDNAAAKLEAYNKNDEAKISTYNANDKAKTDAYNNNASHKEETFNTNAADKQNEFDENASDKLAEYNQNAKELINKVEQVQAENEILKAENKLIKEQIPSATASGNNIHLEDSSNLNFDWKINGNQHQATREGYNKIDLSSISTEVAGIKASYDNETGYITFNGTSTQNYPNFLHEDINEMLVDGETWNIWQENAPSDTNHEIFLQVSAVNKTGGTTRYYTSATKEKRKSFVIDKEQYTYTIDLIGGIIANIGTLTNYKNRYMLYKGTEDKTYEQYGASPSPDYPSEVETVGNNVNYFDIDTVTSITNAEKNTNEIISSEFTGDWKYAKIVFSNIELIADTYTISFKARKIKGTYSDNIGLQVINSSGKVEELKMTEKRPKLSEKYQIYSFTFNVTANINVKTLLFQLQKNASEVVMSIKDIKIEKGSAATPWSPYGMGSVETDVVNKNIMPIVNLGTSWEYTERGIKSFGKNKGTDITKFYIKKGQTIKIGLKLLSQSTVDTTFIWYVDNVPGIIPSFGRIQNLNLNQVYERSYTADKDCEIKGTRWGDEVSDIFEFQLWAEIDNLTNYIKHQSQTAIMPIQQEMLTGDYISSVEHHEWKKLVLAGDEYFEIATSSNGFNAFLNRKIISDNSLEDITTYCNNFKSAADINFNLMEDNTIFGGRGYQHQLLIRCDKYTTIEDFKAMLKSKYEAGTPVTIYYKLAKPLNLELTSEQKAVQNQKLYTYKNVTNIAVSDELASIDITYKKDLETEHNKLQNQIDEIKQLISTTETSALLLDNLQKDVETEVE